MPRAANETAFEREALARKLRHERKRRGWTMARLAIEANLRDKTNIYKYENGRSTPSIISAKQIARAFGMTLDELFNTPLPATPDQSGT